MKELYGRIPSRSQIIIYIIWGNLKIACISFLSFFLLLSNPLRPVGNGQIVSTHLRRNQGSTNQATDPKSQQGSSRARMERQLLRLLGHSPWTPLPLLLACLTLPWTSCMYEQAGCYLSRFLKIFSAQNMFPPMAFQGTWNPYPPLFKVKCKHITLHRIVPAGSSEPRTDSVGHLSQEFASRLQGLHL